jgi:hypothetical protein
MKKNKIWNTTKIGPMIWVSSKTKRNKQNNKRVDELWQAWKGTKVKIKPPKRSISRCQWKTK